MDNLAIRSYLCGHRDPFRVGPLGAAPGMSKLVEVHFLKVVTRGESAVLALRWEATGPGGRPFSPAPRSRPAPCRERT